MKIISESYYVNNKYDAIDKVKAVCAVIDFIAMMIITMAFIGVCVTNSELLDNYMITVISTFQ